MSSNIRNSYTHFNIIWLRKYVLKIPHQEYLGAEKNWNIWRAEIEKGTLACFGTQRRVTNLYRAFWCAYIFWNSNVFLCRGWMTRDMQNKKIEFIHKLTLYKMKAREKCCLLFYISEYVAIFLLFSLLQWFGDAGNISRSVRTGQVKRDVFFENE